MLQDANLGAKKMLPITHKLPVTLPYKDLEQLCHKNNIKKLSLFGSVLRHDITSSSDIDLLVELKPNHTPGLAFFTIQDDLSALFKRQVDLNTPQCLSPYFRQQVLNESRLIYEQTGATL